ncbi:MAG: GIY-YIG nuclease family protein [bacterium]
MSIKRIGIDHIKDVAHQLAVATCPRASTHRRAMSWDEPMPAPAKRRGRQAIPAFETRFPKVLESCLSAPFQTYNRKDLYPTLEDKAAILFYLLIKNHPFQNLLAPQSNFKNSYFIYVLECSDGTNYIGQTQNLEKRIKQHELKLNHWTKSRLPIKLIYFEELVTREEAVTREQELKSGFGRKWIKREKKIAARQASGNKRIAVTTLMIFLLFNQKWLTIQPAKLYNLAIWVAQSDTEVRDAVIAGVRDLISKYSKKVK